MRRYTFEVVIDEGSDEFWESLAATTGCDEVHELLVQALTDAGLAVGETCQVVLREFRDTR